MKTRMLLSVLMLLVLGVTSAAQGKPAVKPEAGPDGKMKVKLSGELKDLPIEETIKWWCEYEKVEVLYNPSQVASLKFAIMCPASGTEIPTDKFGQLLADALEQFKLVLIEISENRYSIVQATEACTQAPILDVEAARKAVRWKYATVRLPLRHSDANACRAALQNLVSRQGGSVMPVQLPQYLLICDRVDRLQRFIDTVEAMEAEGARRTVRTYEMPEGVDSDKVQAAFAVFIGELSRYERPQPNTAALPNTVVVRGLPEELALCDELYKQICANAPKIAAQTKEVSRRYEIAKSPELFVESLTKLFKDQLTASVVPGANAILVKATAAKQEEVKAALELMK